MKFVYLLVALVFVGCSQVEPKVEKAVETKKEAQVAEVKQAVEVKKETVKKEEVLDEPKVTKKVGADIPTSCYMWSDGCNVCTKVGDGTKASCTTNECTNKMFSCLQWY